jgi:hypothetical protein
MRYDPGMVLYFPHKEETLLLSFNPDNMVTISTLSLCMKFFNNLLQPIKNRI